MTKKLLVSIFTCGAVAMLSVSAYATCGSIACNSDGTWCTGAAGYESESGAEFAAVSYCNSQNGGNCYVEQSECNTCIYTNNGASACN